MAYISGHTTPMNMQQTYLRMKPGGEVEQLPVDNEFWPNLMQGELGSFRDEHLVCCLSFDKDWDSWEMHPAGDEIVILLNGSVDFILETEEGEQVIETRQPGQFVLVPRGHWHTANINESATMVFITPGEGTQGKPRARM